MTNYTAARTNMVDSQIHTMGVVNEDILNAFRTVPREQFVPTDRMGIAYNDEDIRISATRYLMEPVTHARLLQAVAPVRSDNVLDIGGATGYSAAILSALCEQVTAVDEDSVFLAHAEKQCAALGRSGVFFHQGDLKAGYAAHAPYSLIFVNGAVASISPAWFEQLASGGRLVAVQQGQGERIGRAAILRKNESGYAGEQILFEAAVPFLPGFEPQKEFVF